MESRATIDQARGVLMATCGCGAQTAWETLVRISNRANVKVRAIARWVVSAIDPDDTVSISPTLQDIIHEEIRATKDTHHHPRPG